MTDARTIVDLISSDYDDNGRRLMLVCPLPEHADSLPSCAVFLDEGRFKCFGCDEQGTVLQLYARAFGMSEDRAEAEIARLTGAPPPRSQRPDPEPMRVVRRRGETRLAEIRGALPLAEHAALGEKLDKMCWAYTKALLDAEQLAGALARFLKETDGLLRSA